MNRWLKYHLPPVLWTLLILLLLGLPADNLESISFWDRIPHFDKAAHLIIFMLWALLMQRSAAQYMHTQSRFLRMGMVFSAGIVLALTTEGLQLLTQTGRSAESGDIIADLTGVLAGFLAYYLIIRKFVKKQTH